MSYCATWVWQVALVLLVAFLFATGAVARGQERLPLRESGQTQQRVSVPFAAPAAIPADVAPRVFLPIVYRPGTIDIKFGTALLAEPPCTVSNEAPQQPYGLSRLAYAVQVAGYNGHWYSHQWTMPPGMTPPAPSRPTRLIYDIACISGTVGLAGDDKLDRGEYTLSVFLDGELTATSTVIVQ